MELGLSEQGPGLRLLGLLAGLDGVFGESRQGTARRGMSQKHWEIRLLRNVGEVEEKSC